MNLKSYLTLALSVLALSLAVVAPELLRSLHPGTQHTDPTSERVAHCQQLDLAQARQCLADTFPSP